MPAFGPHQLAGPAQLVDALIDIVSETERDDRDGRRCGCGDASDAVGRAGSMAGRNRRMRGLLACEGVQGAQGAGVRSDDLRKPSALSGGVCFATLVPVDQPGSW